MKRLIWIAVIGVAVSGVAYSLFGRALPVEMISPTVTTVREYVAEDAKTRLADEYVIDMPIAGTLERLELEIGDEIKKGQVIARIDPFVLEQQIRQMVARVEQSRAQVTGVDVGKPKEEDLRSAAVRVQESRNSLEVARKTKSVAEINHDEAKKAFDRAQTLLGDGAVSQSFFDEAEMRYKGLAEDLKRLESQEAAASQALELAELADQRMRGSIDDNEYMRRLHLAEIEALESQLDMLKNDLAKTQLASPVTGPVIEKFVDDRGVFAPGAPILKIGDLASIEIECDVLSEEIAAIRVGSPVEISGKALLGKMIAGEVKRVFPTGFMKMSALGVEQQRVKTLIMFDNSQTGLRPGTSVDVKIITAESKDVLAVPDRSTIRRNNAWHVFKVEGGRAKLSPVRIGLRNDDWAEIVEGLKPDDTIIAEPKNELADGARVKRLN